MEVEESSTEVGSTLYDLFNKLAVANQDLLEQSSYFKIYEDNDSEPYIGQIPLTKQHNTALHDILQCSACRKVPTLRRNDKVMVCENGHHLCSCCYFQKCPICSGRLFAGRNFVVEELLGKMGGFLGLRKTRGLDIVENVGKFRCPHCGEVISPPMIMINHMRKDHADSLTENAVINPCTGWFYTKLAWACVPGQRLVASFATDLGLLSLVVEFPVADSLNPIRAWVQMLQVPMLGTAIYRLNVTTEQKKSFGFVDMPVTPFEEINDSITYVKSESMALNGLTFVQENDTLSIAMMVLLRGKAPMTASAPSWPFVSGDTSPNSNDRGNRRSAARHRRRRRIIKMHEEKALAAKSSSATEREVACSNL